MTKIRSFLLALVASLAIIPVASAHAAVPITPAVSSCSAPVLAFFDDRVCVDPTASGSRRAYIYTNNVLVSSYTLSMQPGSGCGSITPMSAAQFPFQVTPLTGGAVVGYFEVLVSDVSIVQCGGSTTNYYKASSAAIAAMASRVATHTMVHVY
jgi:hypothetical protein